MVKINKKLVALIIIIISILAICYLIKIKKEGEIIVTESVKNIEEDTSNIIEDTKEKKIEEDKKEKQKIKVYIAGEINNEGVYEILDESRIVDVIEIAGGLKEKADIRNINLATKVEDEMKIYIPTEGENVENTSELNRKEEKIENSNNMNKNNTETKNTQTKENKINKININTGTQTELETLPGIGPSLAMKIINYRKENGKFNKIEDLKKVSGIGESKYEKIKEYITI